MTSTQPNTTSPETRRRSRRAYTAALALALLASGSALAAKPAPPEDTTYFAIVLGVDNYLPTATCLDFEADEVCSDNAMCGPWARTTGGVQTRRQTSFSWRFSLDDEGTPAVIDGHGRVDARGRGNSIAAVARGKAEGRIGDNFGIVGKPIDAARCAELVDEFNELVENFSGEDE